MCLGGCGKPAAPGFDLILISVDTLRADRMGVYGAERPTCGDVAQPFSIAWLAQQGTLWEQAWAPAGKTLPSLGSFWTGLFPLEHGGVSNKHTVVARLKSEELAAKGWKLAARVANRSLYPANGLARGFDSYQVLWGEKENQIPQSLVQVASPWIRQKQPLLLWAHFMKPHQPYAPTPPFAGRFTTTGPEGSNQVLADLHRDAGRANPELVEHLKGLYDEEILGTTDLVQRLLVSLDHQYRSAGRGSLMENARIVFFSDHGEELADRHGYFMHAKSLYSGVIQIPVILAGCGIPAGQRRSEILRLEELFSLALEDRAPAGGVHYSAWQAEYFAARNEQWTLVHNPCNNLQGPREKPLDAPYLYPTVGLFHRPTDPLEQNDVSAQNPEIVIQLLDGMVAWYSDLEITPPGIPAGINPTILEQLGYADGFEDNPCAPWSGAKWAP